MLEQLRPHADLVARLGAVLLSPACSTDSEASAGDAGGGVGSLGQADVHERGAGFFHQSCRPRDGPEDLGIQSAAEKLSHYTNL